METSRSMHKGDYYGTHQVNAGSKMMVTGIELVQTRLTETYWQTK